MSAAACSASSTGALCRPCDGVKPFRPAMVLGSSWRAQRCASSASASTSGVCNSMQRIPRCAIVAPTRPSFAACGASSSAAAATVMPSDQAYAHLPFAGAVVASAKLIAAVLQLVISATNKVRDTVAAAFPQLANVKPEDMRQQLQQIKAVSTGMKWLAFVAPFAKAAASESLTAVYTRTFERAAFGFAKMYLFCLFMRVLLSWFPSIDWNAQPWTFLRLITEPYLQIYRGILPPLFGQLDFTPLFGFLILQDVVEVMAPTYTMGMHAGDTSTRWTTSDVMCYFDGF